MSNASDWVPYLVATVLFYGLAQALTKQFMANLTAYTFILLYVITKAVINVAAFYGLGKVPLFTPEADHFIQLAVVGNIVNGFAWLFFYKALESGKVSLAGSIAAGYPALTVVLALIFLGEHLVWYQALGVVAVVGSGIMMAFGPGDAAEEGAPKGDRRWLIYALLVFICWGVFSAFIKACFMAKGADTYTFFIWNAIGAAVVLVPYSLWGVLREGLGKAEDILKALFPTVLFVLGDLALYRAYEFGPATIVSPLSVIYPVITLMYAVPVLKERISGLQWAAITLMMAGIVAVSLPAS